MKKIAIIYFLIFSSIYCFSQTFNTQRMDSLFKILESKDKFMGSITVSRNGELLYSNTIGYANMETSKKASTKTKYRIGSISKMFTAVLTLKAVEENKLSLNQTLDKYFPQIKNSRKITISNLLNHRSGIHNFTDDSDYLEYNTQPKTQKEMLEIIAKKTNDFEPDSKAEYSNSNYVLLSYILEKVYKKQYSTILNDKIIVPLQLKNTYYGGKTNINDNESYSYYFKNGWQKEPETDMSIPIGAGAIISNTTDLTLFINGLFDGKLISEKSLSLMKTVKDGFGMGMFENPITDKKSFGHDGAIDRFQSLLTYFPEEKLAIAIITNGSSYKNSNILLCAESCYFNKPFQLPTFKNNEVSSEILDLYVGEYASEQIPLTITVTKVENQLFAQANGQSAFPLDASSETLFKFEQAGIALEFNSKNKQMTLKQSGKEITFTKK